MANDIASDPRFRHVLTDPRFKTIPQRSRKVRIGSRFQSMFTDHKFKVKYGVDKRGRRVDQTSSEDMQKYYDLHDDTAMTSHDVMQGDPPLKNQKSRKVKVKCVARGNTGRLEERMTGREVAAAAEEGSDHTHWDSSRSGGGTVESDALSGDGDGGDVSDGDSGDSDSSTDVEEIMALQDPEVVHGWWDDEVSPSHSVETGSKLALCRMDWDRVNATDILVFLSSFKPQGGSILQVAILPSDFGLQRMKSEDVQGPAELLDQPMDGVLQEGRGYSSEHLRQYQLQRLNYYYAVVECDSTATAEYIYDQCDGVEYEHCGGRLDLRFIPNGMTFDDWEPKSVATETHVPAGYNPPEFVTSALQQSKVQLTWDETDPQRLKTTMRKFSRDDMLQMDFDAYLASSSGESGSECGTSGEGGGMPKADHSASDKVTKYRSLLADGDKVGNEGGSEGGDGGGSGEEVVEISWEPGLREGVEEMVRRRQEEGGEGTTWDQYLKERNKKTKERRAKGNHDKESSRGDDIVAQDAGLGFDDPFFKQDVAVATAGKKNERRKMAKEGEKREEEKSQLELLMMEGEEVEGGRAHFSLDSIIQQEREAGKKATRRRKRKEKQASQTDSFEVDVSDSRFSALYSNHLYAPDPAHPHYRPTKAMSALMEERRKRREGGSREEETTPSSDQTQLTDPSVSQLVKAVKSKARSLNERRKKLKAKRTVLQM